MLRRGQIGLPQANVATELVEEDEAGVDNDDQCQNKVHPVSIVIFGSDVGPAQYVHAGNITVDGIVVSVLSHGEL